MRAANPQVLSRHLVLEMVCGLPTRRYFQGIWCLKWCAGCQPAGTFNRYFQGIWCLKCCAGCQPAGTLNPQLLSRHLVLEMHCGLPTRRYFQSIWCLKGPADCQPAGTFKAFGAWNALRAANPQVLSRHLVLEMPCGLPTCRCFQGIWCLKCPAGCQPAGTFKAFGA